MNKSSTLTARVWAVEEVNDKVESAFNHVEVRTVKTEGKTIPIRLWNSLKISGTHGKYSSMETGFEIVGEVQADRIMEDLANHQDMIVSIIQKLQNHTCIGSRQPAPWFSGQPAATAGIAQTPEQAGGHVALWPEAPVEAPTEAPSPTPTPAVKRRRKVV